MFLWKRFFSYMVSFKRKWAKNGEIVYCVGLSYFVHIKKFKKILQGQILKIAVE